MDGAYFAQLGEVGMGSVLKPEREPKIDWRRIERDDRGEATGRAVQGVVTTAAGAVTSIVIPGIVSIGCLVIGGGLLTFAGYKWYCHWQKNREQEKR